MKTILTAIIVMLIATVCGCAELRSALRPAPSNTEAFQTAGFTRGQAEWLAEGFDDQDIVVTPLMALKYKSEYYPTPAKRAVIDDWIEFNFNFAEAGPWAVQGFSPREAASWKSDGYDPERAAEEKNRQLQTARNAARDEELKEWQESVDRLKSSGYTTEGEQSNDDLLKANPYAIKGKCFYLKNIECLQLHDRHAGLYVIGRKGFMPQLAALQFKPTDAIGKNARFFCRAIGTGTLEYTSAAGTLEIVPILRVVAIYRHGQKEAIYVSAK